MQTTEEFDWITNPVIRPGLCVRTQSDGCRINKWRAAVNSTSSGLSERQLMKYHLRILIYFLWQQIKLVFHINDRRCCSLCENRRSWMDSTRWWTHSLDDRQQWLFRGGERNCANKSIIKEEIIWMSLWIRFHFFDEGSLKDNSDIHENHLGMLTDSWLSLLITTHTAVSTCSDKAHI